ncbi:ABC transporter permease [Flavivirga algicola]|uniref:FtsX-like permease family protein n=1 Tax=Flavivirga algicola TaxID=2729136 RepID=A0ABX1RZ89_9FLAO|nr:ABC transporter permease [Flavivirga algicola]NMH88904.1 FtsX-like permease family protein [Flavivirga algicola]
MIRNYFKIAWRNLIKDKLQTSINLLGLTIGMVSCLAILVYVVAQFGYDTHYENADSIYRLRTKIKTIKNNSINSDWACASPPIAPAMKEDFPEVSEVCRIVYFGKDNASLLRVDGDEESYYESGGYVADSTFFKLFDYPLIEGNKNALNAPNTVVLSSKLAKKLFKNEDALNKTLLIGNRDFEAKYTVTGVFNEDNGKTHLNPNYIICMQSQGVGNFVINAQNFATHNFVYSYIKLKEDTNAANLEKKLPAFLNNRGSKHIEAMGFEKTLLLQPLKDIHLHSKGISSQIETVSNIENLYVMLILGGIILLVACINFINLSTARTSKRAKEIGVRKVIGASKASLARQFLSESLLLSLFAVIISIPIVILLLPFINDITQGDLALSHIFNIKILACFIVLGIFTGLMAGAYPAIILSAIKPVKVLKGVFNLQPNNGNLRKGLVVFQFVVSITLVIAVTIVTQQLKYAQNIDMGFDKENLITINLGSSEAITKFEPLREKISTIPGVSGVSGSNNYPSLPVRNDMGFHLPGQDPTNQTLIYVNGARENYFNTVGTKILSGRGLQAGDNIQSKVIVNEATLKAFNIPLESAVSSKIVGINNGQPNEFEIVGVIEDYLFASLKETINPMVILYDNTPDWLITKTESADLQSLLTQLEDAWKSVNPNTPFVYTFVDEEVAKLFKEEQRLGKISSLFTFLAILISCLGLFGLVSFIAEQKKKEIGIRKVLGASIQTVVQLMTKDYIILVMIAFIIATPLAYYLMQQWLEDFQYRIEIKWWVFLLAGVATLMITLLTVGVQSVKSAIANPIKSLRTE